MAEITVVVGGQYGSEAKGAVAAAHIRRGRALHTLNVRIGGSNAGHTVIGKGPGGDEHAWRLRHVPVGAVADPESTLFIAAGSEVDLDVLYSEITALDEWGYGVSDRLIVDEQATWVDPDYHTLEQLDDLTARLGSTGKGVGAARSARIMRTAQTIKDITGSFSDDFPFQVVNGVGYMQRALALEDLDVVVEGTQGYGLGLHAGHYPFCTSGNCRAIDFLSQAGLSPWDANVSRLRVYVVIRPNPIRVAGNSGWMKNETSWEDLGLDPELTTVTKKVRRVGGWDSELAQTAVRANGGPPVVEVALSMADHVFPAVAGRSGVFADADGFDSPEVADWIASLEREIGAPITYIGTGPNSGVWIDKEGN